jgi:hypothetical protein
MLTRILSTWTGIISFSLMSSTNSRTEEQTIRRQFSLPSGQVPSLGGVDSDELG